MHALSPRFASLGILPLAGCYWMIWGSDPGDMPETGVPEVSCGPGEIRHLGSGRLADGLVDALQSASPGDGFCLGEGTHRVATLIWEPGVGWGPSSSLRLVGAGSVRTILEGEITAAAPGYSFLALDLVGRVEIEALGVRGLPLRIEAGQATLTDLVLDPWGGAGPLLTLGASELDIDGLTVTGATIAAASPLVLRGSGTVLGLVLTENQLGAGRLLETSQELALIAPEITGNVAMSDEAGVEVILASGDLSIQGGRVADNRSSGPSIRASSSLELQDVELVGNDSGWEGIVAIPGRALVSGGSVTDNRVGTGAFELGDASTLQLDGVDFGAHDHRNVPCDVAVAVGGGFSAVCLATELGEDASLVCDREGCR